MHDRLGPGLRGEPKWLYSADGGHKKNALSPEIDAAASERRE